MSEEHAHVAHESSSGSARGAITIRLPNVDWQIVALLLVALVAAFQTFQLARLKGNVTIRPSSSAPAAAPAGGAGNGLQSMVGGC